MATETMAKLNAENLNSDIPDFMVGDTVKVHVRIREMDKERIQVYEGTVIAKDGGASTESYTVRRISHGVGVERVFPVHSPNVQKLEVIKQAHIRQAKLYYLRDRVGKKVRLKEKIRRHAK